MKKNQSNVLIALKLAIRNILLKPMRALMTVIGVTGCVALLVCAFGIGDTINHCFDYEFEKQFRYDYNTAVNESYIPRLNAYLDDINAEYEPYKTFYMTAAATKSKDIKVFVYQPASRFTSIDTSDGKVYISTSTAKQLGAKQGDTVTLAAGNNKYAAKIDFVIDTAVTQGIFLYTTDFDAEYHSLNYWINVASPSSDILKGINDNNGTQNAYDTQSMYDKVANAISSIDTIKTTLMIFATLLSVIVLFNIALLNTKERVRDISTLKVLGFSNRDISLSLTVEIMILVLIATAIGLLLGYPVLVLVMSNNSVEAMAFIYYIKPISYVFSAAISIVTALIINLLFGLKIKKINMLDALKSVE